MAYIQNVSPPANRVNTFSIRDFSGGLNNNSDLLENNEGSDVKNLIHSDMVLLERRKGQEYIGTFNYGSEISFIDEFKPYNLDNVLVVATNSHMFLGQNVLTSVKGHVDGVNHDGKYFLTDGQDLYVYGLHPQTTSTYQRIIGTPINAYVLLKVISPVVDHVKLDASHVKGVIVVDYTNYTICYEPCKNEFEDPFKGANITPETVQFITSHNGRLFMSGNKKDDDNVFITDIRNPFYFPVYLPIQLPPNSDKVKGLEVFDNSVVVSRENDKYAITGNIANPNLGTDLFRLKKINTHTGIASNDVMDVAHGFLFYLGNDGAFYALDTTRDNSNVVRSVQISKKLNLFKEPINITKEDLSKANSIFCKDFWYVRVGNKLLVYYYLTRSWVYFTNVLPTAMYILNGELIYGLANGRLAKFSDTMLDFGVPYQSRWYSKFYDMGDANSQKQFREFFVIAHTFTDKNSDIKFLYEIDYSDVLNSVTIKNQITVWGKSRFGDRIINRQINESFPMIIGRRGRNIRIKFHNGYDVYSTVATREELVAYVGRKEGMVIAVTEDNTYNIYEDRSWRILTNEELSQKAKIYQINGDYEMRGKR